MTRYVGGQEEPNELIQVVLDDASADRLREAAAVRGIDVEQVIVQLLHLGSFRIESILGGPGESAVAPRQA